jgi:hypothetical protein
VRSRRVDFVGEHEGEEVLIRQRLLLRERDPLGEDVQHLPEFESAQQRLQFRVDARCGRCGRCGGGGCSRLAPPGLVFGVVAGEPRRPTHNLRRRRCGVAFAGLFEHPGDLDDVDDVELEGAGAGGVDRAGPVGSGQPEQPVDPPHARPGQRHVEQPGGGDAHVRAGRSDFLGQGVDVAQRVVRRSGRQVTLSVERPPGGSRRWGIDQLTTPVDLPCRPLSARASTPCPINSPGTE